MISVRVIEMASPFDVNTVLLFLTVAGTKNLKEGSGNLVIFFLTNFVVFSGYKFDYFGYFVGKFPKISDITKLKKISC